MKKTGEFKKTRKSRAKYPELIKVKSDYFKMKYDRKALTDNNLEKCLMDIEKYLQKSAKRLKAEKSPNRVRQR